MPKTRNKWERPKIQSANLEAFFDSLKNELDTFGGRSNSNLLLRSKILVSHAEKGQIVGLAGVSKDNLFFLLVKSDYQNMGIGQLLIKKVILETIARRFSHITLFVCESNSKAVYIYKKFGFKPLYSYMQGQKKYLFMILPLNMKGIIFEIIYTLVQKFFSKINRKKGKWRFIFSFSRYFLP
ncbi:MAG: GNAT family N-acetyltransferase [Candidatus Bathyarchaeia archaeon]|jgi:ribosomal protein S18 acetylase RimI-like enzyme